MTRMSRSKSVRGFSWARNSPYVRRPAAKSQIFLSMAKAVSLAREPQWACGSSGWSMLQKRSGRTLSRCPGAANFLDNDRNHSAKILSPRRILNPCWQTAIMLLESHNRGTLIQLQSSKNAGLYQATRNKRDTHGPLGAFCVSNDRESWHWNGMFEQSRSVPLPDLVREEILFV